MAAPNEEQESKAGTLSSITSILQVRCSHRAGAQHKNADGLSRGPPDTAMAIERGRSVTKRSHRAEHMHPMHLFETALAGMCKTELTVMRIALVLSFPYSPVSI